MAPIGFRKHVLETREPLLFDVITPELLAEYDATGSARGRAAEVVGVGAARRLRARRPASISLQNLDREHAFSEADLRLLTTLAGSLSVALENARLFEETRQRNAELALINDVQRSLAENLEMHAMYELDRRPAAGDLRRAGRRHRRARPRVRQASVPVLDRARRPLPG